MHGVYHHSRWGLWSKHDQMVMYGVETEYWMLPRNSLSTPTRTLQLHHEKITEGCNTGLSRVATMAW